jgi:4-amino-4-deoxy-L-arabinose transferase-like glycosyltransferase
MTARRPFGPWLVALLAAGAMARLGVMIGLDPTTWVAGSDSPFYAAQGWRLAHGMTPLFPPVSPAYTWLVAAAWSCCPAMPLPQPSDAIPAAVLTIIRVVQILASLAMVWAAIVLVRRWTSNDRAALVTGAGLAFGPAFLLEPFRILTETAFMSLLYVGLLLWSIRQREQWWPSLTAGLVFGLAALTRPVVMLLPAALVVSELCARRDRLRGRRAAAFLVSFTVVAAPWSFSLHHQTGSWLPSGFFANLWIGAVGDGSWHGGDAADARRSQFADGPDDYLGETVAVIRDAPVGWFAVRARNFGAALLRPHFVSELPGPSTRRAVVHWWLSGRRPGTLMTLAVTPVVILKLIFFAAHWLALLGGLAGLVRWRHHWRELLPLWTTILYFPTVHLLLTALPRYLFPIEPALWIAVGLFVSDPGSTARSALSDRDENA